MIKEIIEKWDKNKCKLEEYFRTKNQTSFSSYDSIVKLIFQLVINVENEFEWDNFDVEKMTVIDDGHYQGTRIFIIPKDTYQPGIEDYLVIDTYYGSCPGCDTLEAINRYDEDLASEDQVKEYMTIALHLIQKMKWLSDASV